MELLSSFIYAEINSLTDDLVFQSFTVGQQFNLLKQFVCASSAVPLIVRVPSVVSGLSNSHSVLVTGLTTYTDQNNATRVTATILDPSGKAYTTLNSGKLNNALNGIRPLVAGSVSNSGGYLTVAISGNANISAVVSDEVKRALAQRKGKASLGSNSFIYQNDTASDATDSNASADQLQTLTLYNPPAGNYSFSVSAATQNGTTVPSPYAVQISQLDGSGNLVSTQQSSGVTSSTPASISYVAPSSISYGIVQAANVAVTYGAATNADSLAFQGTLVPLGSAPTYNLQNQAMTITYAQMGVYLQIPAGGFTQFGGGYQYTSPSPGSGVNSVSVGEDGSLEIQASGLNLLGISQTSFGPIQIQIGSTMYTGQPAGPGASNGLAQLGSSGFIYSIGSTAYFTASINSTPTNADDEYILEAAFNGQPVALYKVSSSLYSYATPLLSAAGLQKFSVSSFIQNKRIASELGTAIANIQMDVTQTENSFFQETDPKIIAQLQARIASDKSEIAELRIRLRDNRSKAGSEMNLYFRVD